MSEFKAITNTSGNGVLVNPKGDKFTLQFIKKDGSLSEPLSFAAKPVIELASKAEVEPADRETPRYNTLGDKPLAVGERVIAFHGQTKVYSTETKTYSLVSCVNIYALSEKRSITTDEAGHVVMVKGVPAIEIQRTPGRFWYGVELSQLGAALA